MPNLPDRWLVTGKSEVHDENPVMFTDAYMTPASDCLTIWTRPYSDRPRYSARIESIFRAIDDGTLIPSSVLTDRQIKGIQAQTGTDFQQILNEKTLDNRPLSTVSNRSFRQLMDHSTPLNTPD
ncbi:hypothetical protein INT44_002668 [Umbelopsis vinacea]|uniref:Uncharacterized protein n=1 Tax=Umbelopsis vinacea TaxID=44442 RepID=A0A8H7PEW6_9FUNG|nr:hypothetical protein INT44_002668 [Umbelopsis vinacea]